MVKLIPFQQLSKSIIVPALVIFLALAGTKSDAHGANPSGEAIIFVASQYTYVREKTNHNDAPEIDLWLKFVGLDNKVALKTTGTGYSYCAAYGCSMIGETYKYAGKKTPFLKLARCATVLKMARKDKYTYNVIPAKQVYIGAVDLQAADAVIWSHKKKAEYDWDGHFGLVVKQIDETYFKTIEGNTVGTDAVDGQREQVSGSKNLGGVYYKKRNLNPNWAFNPEAFIRINEVK
jgi:hypothetical protein